MESVKVFISWSGDHSREVANLLKRYLRVLVQSSSPWLSAVDIRSGNRWRDEIARELDSTHFGVVVLNSANASAPWIQFESGAIAKSLVRGNLVPVLCCGMSAGKMPDTLSQFQAVAADKLGLEKLFLDIGSLAGVADDVVRSTFEQFWPTIEQELRDLDARLCPEADKVAQAVSSSDDELQRLQRTIEELQAENAALRRQAEGQSRSFALTPEMEELADEANTAWWRVREGALAHENPTEDDLRSTHIDLQRFQRAFENFLPRVASRYDTFPRVYRRRSNR